MRKASLEIGDGGGRVHDARPEIEPNACPAASDRDRVQAKLAGEEVAGLVGQRPWLVDAVEVQFQRVDGFQAQLGGPDQRQPVGACDLGELVEQPGVGGLELDGVAVGSNPVGLPAWVRPTRWKVPWIRMNGIPLPLRCRRHATPVWQAARGRTAHTWGRLLNKASPSQDRSGSGDGEDRGLRPSGSPERAQRADPGPHAG
jgi:hypothetical protein